LTVTKITSLDEEMISRDLEIIILKSA